MKAIALFVVCSAGLWAATRTSTQTGVWSATATWGGSAAPVAGDTAVIATGTVVTVDGTQTVGTSGIAGTTAITIAGTGQLTGAAAATLNVRGDIVVPVQGTLTGAVTGSNAWTLNFDTTVVGSSVQYRMKTTSSGAWTWINATNLTVTATTGNFASIDNTDISQGGMLTCVNCTFRHIHILPAPNPAVLAPLVLTNVIMDDSYVDVPYNCVTNCVVQLNQVTWKNSTAADNFRMNADGTGTCSFIHIVSDYVLGNGVGGGGGGAYNGCTFQDVLARNSVQLLKAASHTNSIYLLNGSVAAQEADGNMSGVWAWQYAHDGTTHTHLMDISGTSDYSFSRVSLLSSTNPNALVAIDGFVDQRTGYSDHFARGLLLNRPNGTASASYFDKLGQAVTAITFDHMTLSACLNDTAPLSIEAEGTTGGYGSGAFLTNSLFWCPTADGQVALNSELQQNGWSTQVTDPMPPASINHNGKWNVKTSGIQNSPCNLGCTNTAGYQAGIWTGTPGTADVIGNPTFVDSTRTPETWASRYLYPYLSAAAPSAWVTSHVYAVGDVVRNTKAGNPYGQEIYFRCVTAHTSAAGTEPGSDWNGLATWWTDWKLETVERIADAITAGSTITDPTISCASCTYIEAMTNWVYAGFTPANAAFHTASDSGWMGAVNASAAASTVAGGKAVVGGNAIAR